VGGLDEDQILAREADAARVLRDQIVDGREPAVGRHAAERAQALRARETLAGRARHADHLDQDHATLEGRERRHPTRLVDEVQVGIRLAQPRRPDGRRLRLRCRLCRAGLVAPAAGDAEDERCQEVRERSALSPLLYALQSVARPAQ
jgi:hypothetical protein